MHHEGHEDTRRGKRKKGFLNYHFLRDLRALRGEFFFIFDMEMAVDRLNNRENPFPDQGETILTREETIPDRVETFPGLPERTLTRENEVLTGETPFPGQGETVLTREKTFPDKEKPDLTEEKRGMIREKIIPDQGEAGNDRGERGNYRGKKGHDRGKRGHDQGKNRSRPGRKLI
ncbi:MAG: hypothetical protein JW768_12090 [Chitinispirillaceae bacterium]|nr:hypothetical protein [Chitinispirillaceae bacterium]